MKKVGISERSPADVIFFADLRKELRARDLFSVEVRKGKETEVFRTQFKVARKVYKVNYIR